MHVSSEVVVEGRRRRQMIKKGWVLNSLINLGMIQDPEYIRLIEN